MRKTNKTKEILINSAGELFAEYGFSNVSTRKIADRAGVKLGAIHYHFGSKENLYIDACLAAHSRGCRTNFTDVISEQPHLVKTPEGQAEIIKILVFRTFESSFRPDRDEWEVKLLLREIASPSTGMKALAEILLKPDTESAASFYKLIVPGASDTDAAGWTDLLYGKLILYSMGKETINLVRGENNLTPQFYHVSAEKLARAMILEAELPLPEDLKRKNNKELPEEKR